jgi:hypothetical protein
MGQCVLTQPESYAPPPKENIMAKSQKKSSREVRKPKAEKPKKQNASNPSTKGNPAGLGQKS